MLTKKKRGKNKDNIKVLTLTIRNVSIIKVRNYSTCPDSHWTEAGESMIHYERKLIKVKVILATFENYFEKKTFSDTKRISLSTGL